MVISVINLDLKIIPYVKFLKFIALQKAIPVIFKVKPSGGIKEYVQLYENTSPGSTAHRRNKGMQDLCFGNLQKNGTAKRQYRWQEY
jgi:hypothetical protein